MRHRATGDFWKAYDALPDQIQRLADKNYALLRLSPEHPSLRFKLMTTPRGRRYSVRVGLRYRALGSPIEEGVLWEWIGTHAEYDKLLAGKA